MRAKLSITMLVGFTSALAACEAGRSGLGAISAPTANGTPPIDPDHTGQQGIGLEGGPMDGNRIRLSFSSAVDINGQGFDSVYLDGTELVATRSGGEYRGHQLEGVTFSGSGLDMITYHVIIDAYFVHPDPLRMGPDLADYRVTLVNFGDLCNGRRAMPIGGAWSKEGEHMPDPMMLEFSFACANGVMFKCIDFGYKPWVDIDTTTPTIAGYMPGATGHDLHQTCTRMARADYCADGTSHTMDETWINFYDIFSTSLPVVPDPDSPLPDHSDPNHPGSARYNKYFEAAWRPGKTKPRESAAICLSKKRWSTIKLRGYCAPDVLPDPRQEETATFCDDPNHTERALELNDNALLFNDSAFVDLGLFRWLHSTSPVQDQYTNSEFVDFYLRATDPPPFPFVSPADFEGAVFNYNTRWVPQGLLELWSYYGPSGEFLTTTSASPAPAGYHQHLLEGLVYPPNATQLPLDARPLNLYFDSGTGLYITTTGLTMNPPPASYVYQATIGYLPRGPQ
jgi:hypothetical protein